MAEGKKTSTSLIVLVLIIGIVIGFSLTFFLFKEKQSNAVQDFLSNKFRDRITFEVEKIGYIGAQDSDCERELRNKVSGIKDFSGLDHWCILNDVRVIIEPTTPPEYTAKASCECYYGER